MEIFNHANRILETNTAFFNTKKTQTEKKPHLFHHTGPELKHLVKKHFCLLKVLGVHFPNLTTMVNNLRLCLGKPTTAKPSK